MKKFPNKYKPIRLETRQLSSPKSVIALSWFYAILLGLYFNDEVLQFFRNGESPFSSAMANVVEQTGSAIPFSKWKNQVNGSAQYLYQQEYRFGTNQPNKTNKPVQEEVLSVPTTSSQLANITEQENQINPEEIIDMLPEEDSLPENVLLVGSSSMRSSMGASLSKLLKQSAKVTVHRYAKVGTGLARPDVYDWHKRTLELLEKHEIDLVVAQFIGNDCQNLVNKDHTLEASLNSDEWGIAYQKRVRDFVLAIQAQGIEVTLIGMPIVRSPRFRRRLAYANKLVAEVAAETNSLYITTWEVTSDAKGKYQDSIRVNGRTLKFRHEDGIHLSHAGSKYVAKDIFAQLSKEYPWETPETTNGTASIPTQILP
jgi:hypothetical protein